MPTITCTGVASGTDVGQGDYVDLNNASGEEVLADIRTYCDGATPVYNAEMVTTNSSGQAIYDEGSIPISPGQLVRLGVSDSSRGTHASVFDLSTFKPVSDTGETLGSVIGFVGVEALQGGASGQVLPSGPVPSGAQLVPGPVQSTPAIFSLTTVDGKTLGEYDSANDLSLDEWQDTNGNLVVKTSPFLLDAFTVAVTEPTTGASTASDAPAVAGTGAADRPARAPAG